MSYFTYNTLFKFPEINKNLNIPKFCESVNNQNIKPPAYAKNKNELPKNSTKPSDKKQTV